MTKLSVNINKIATLRNARGGDIPNVVEAAINAERFGADGITVHPRPDERHIKYKDVYDLKKVITTEFNIEGYPSEKFLKLVTDVVPTQVTLVPDPPDALTSDHGWDVKENFSFLKDVIERLKSYGIRVSIFINAELDVPEYAAKVGTDRVELYTEPYARLYAEGKLKEAITPFVETAKVVKEVGLGLNAGHDLNLQNLKYFHENIPYLDEVSIGHALISDAIYYGLENTIMLYKRQLDPDFKKI
jgi:pyridoxine 5-phosphate synthase